MNKPLHPKDLYRIGHIATYLRNVINIKNPQLEDISIIDIIQALNCTIRFNGHSSVTVLEHSINVCNLAPERLKWEALMHDAHEAYIGDIPSPIKHLLPDYQQLEMKWIDVMCERYELCPQKLKEVSAYDRRALELEFTSNFCQAIRPKLKDETSLFIELFNTYSPRNIKKIKIS